MSDHDTTSEIEVHEHEETAQKEPTGDEDQDGVRQSGYLKKIVINGPKLPLHLLEQGLII